MASFNKVILIGNLVADPELKKTPNGVSVTSFRIAVGRRFTRDGEAPQADFIDIVAWRQTAEFVSRYFKKGSMIALQGSIQTRNYEDKQGNKRTAVEVVADNVSFCGSKAESGTQNDFPPIANTAKPAAKVDFEEIDDDDDLPF
jgi:single-strand DNA-binding protein